MYICTSLDVRATIDSSGIPETILMNKNPKHSWMFGQLGINTTGLCYWLQWTNMATLTLYVQQSASNNKEDAKRTKYL